jgi:hypothetical protein
MLARVDILQLARSVAGINATLRRPVDADVGNVKNVDNAVEPSVHQRGVEFEPTQNVVRKSDAVEVQKRYAVDSRASRERRDLLPKANVRLRRGVRRRLALPSLCRPGRTVERFARVQFAGAARASTEEMLVLRPHQVIGKCLFLMQSDPAFENVAHRVTSLVHSRDSRIGVEPNQTTMDCQ